MFMRVKADSALDGTPLAPSICHGSRQSNRFEAMVQGIVTRHVKPHDLLAVTRRLSGRENYLALTFIITARSYEQLDTIYRALSACDDILFSI